MRYNLNGTIYVDFEIDAENETDAQDEALNKLEEIAGEIPNAYIGSITFD
jgi:hypothetical protein